MKTLATVCHVINFLLLILEKAENNLSRFHFSPGHRGFFLLFHLLHISPQSRVDAMKPIVFFFNRIQLQKQSTSSLIVTKQEAIVTTSQEEKKELVCSIRK